MQMEQALDFDEQSSVLFRSRAHAAPPPRVEARRRDAVPPTERADAERDVLARDEGEDVAFRAEQNRMAFFKRSCSSLSSAYSRSSRCSCAISRAGGALAGFAGAPRKRPSRASFRHFDSMKG
jgi:hypothetical protein